MESRKTELEITISVAFAEQLEARAKKLFDAANTAVEEYSTCPADYTAVLVENLLCVHVDEFCEYLRNSSLTLRQILGDRNKPPAGSGKAGSSGSKPKVKKRRGPRVKTDLKADKRPVSSLAPLLAPATDNLVQAGSIPDKMIGIAGCGDDDQAFVVSLSAVKRKQPRPSADHGWQRERAKGLEPSTSSLGS